MVFIIIYRKRGYLWEFHTCASEDNLAKQSWKKGPHIISSWPPGSLQQHPIYFIQHKSSTGPLMCLFCHGGKRFTAFSFIFFSLLYLFLSLNQQHTNTMTNWRLGVDLRISRLRPCSSPAGRSTGACGTARADPFWHMHTHLICMHTKTHNQMELR